MAVTIVYVVATVVQAFSRWRTSANVDSIVGADTIEASG